MMDRLTERDAYWLGEEFWLTAREPDEEEIDKVYEKLKHYEDLAEAGRLIELPCKEIYTSIGDTVYYIYYGEVLECVNCGVQIGCDGKVYIDFACDVHDIVDDYADEWGKTIFLTKEEAEAALKERETRMKSTGIIRTIDELGRVVIPTALRKTMFGTVKCEVCAVEFFPQNDGTIILKRYEPEDKESESE